MFQYKYKQSQYNILVVEDNREISNLILSSLQRHNYSIKNTRRLSIAKKLLNKNHFDLICLDLILPDGDGYEILKDKEKKYHLNNTKILVISRKNSVNHIVEGLNRGVDDYLPKPFHPEELSARVKKLLKESKNHVYQSRDGLLKLNKRTMQVEYDDYSVSLTKTEFLIFQYIFNNDGFSRTESLVKFLETQTAKNYNDTILTTAIKRLRDKFKRITGDRIIKNKYGIGYYIS